MQPDLIGQTLGKYQIVEEIGRGGMGVVYKARDPMLDRLVAIKVLAPQLAWDQEFVHRFRNEARAAARLRHGNIVAIYDIGESGGYHFIVMDYLRGLPLSEVILREGPLPPDRVANLLSQVAEALDYAHARGFIHRDVKPGNIIVSSQNHATLTDFGLAKAMVGTRLTRSGMMLGTPAYMSPEQIEGSKLTRATDIYSLGIVAYEMLTRQVPFAADTPGAVMYAQVHKSPAPLRNLNAKVPAAVQSTVLKALAKRPEDRWPNAGAFAHALRKAAARVSASREGPGSGVDLPRLATLLGAGLTTIVVLIVLAALAIGRFGAGSAAPAPTEAVGVAASSTPVMEPTDVPATATSIPTSQPSPTAMPQPTRAVAVVATPTPEPTSVEVLLTATLVPTQTPGATATLQPTRTPESTATLVPTSTPVPTRTVTGIPTPTRTPTPAPASTPIPSGAAVVLLEPPNGAEVEGLVNFRWRWAGSLGESEVFDVRVCKGEGCQPEFGKTNVRETTWQWLPDEGAGPYRWQVVVIRKEGDRVVAEPARSSIRGFEWLGGGGEPPPSEPGPTPTR